MNYLKTISFINKSEYLSAEKDAQKTNYEACNLIKEIAQKMYDRELDFTKYRLWEAILAIIDNLKHSR